MEKVTKRAKAAEHTLANQITVDRTELFRLLVESIQDYAIFMLDPSGRVISWNAGAQQLKGYHANEIIGKHLSVFYPEADVKNGKPAYLLSKARRQGRAEDEGWRVKKDGGVFWANVTITALYDNSGRLQGYAKITRDLSERKGAEDELKRINRQLRRQQKKLQELNKSREEFFSIVSHELRTPATVVKQYLGILQAGYAGPLNSKQVDYIEKANSSNDRQISIADDLIKVAQVDAGKIMLHKSMTDITQLVQGVLAEQADALMERGQHGAFKAPMTPVVSEVDAGRIRMVIENLLTNASKYTPRNGEISVSVANSADGVKISIADTGVGIKNADMPKLFKQFSRIPNELSENAGGSGLGLYWANKVIQLHKGHIAVSSKVGRGSRFDIFIPRGGSDEHEHIAG